jgi:hypothetical protein
VKPRGGIQPSKCRLLLTIFTALALLWLSLVARSESKSDEPFLVWVVGIEGSVQYSTKYTISASGAPPGIVATVKPSADGRSDALADMLTRWRRREDEARALAGQLASRLPPGAKWVKISPDRQYGLVGFEDARNEALRTADLVHIASRERLKEFVFSYSKSIEDAEWSQDSRLLGVLISRERWSRSPLDLLLTILGRPTPLMTFSVSLTDARSLQARQILIATDVRYGTGMISRNVDLLK